jgi:hypothetical protein
MLSDEWKRSKYAMPENIRRTRNIAISLGFIEFVCCILAIGFYIRRRSRVIIVFIVIAFIASILGMWAKLRLSFWGLATHAALTIAVIGAFYIYLIIEFALGIDSKTKGGLNETIILILLSLPLLLIFVLGIYSLVLLLEIDEELEEREK